MEIDYREIVGEKSLAELKCTDIGRLADAAIRAYWSLSYDALELLYGKDVARKINRYMERSRII